MRRWRHDSSYSKSYCGPRGPGRRGAADTVGRMSALNSRESHEQNKTRDHCQFTSQATSTLQSVHITYLKSILTSYQKMRQHDACRAPAAQSHACYACCHQRLLRARHACYACSPHLLVTPAYRTPARHASNAMPSHLSHPLISERPHPPCAGQSKRPRSLSARSAHPTRATLAETQ